MMIYKNNFHYIKKVQKQYHNKVTRPRSYVLDNKVYLYSKYIKTINGYCKLETSFFEPFEVVDLVRK